MCPATTGSQFLKRVGSLRMQYWAQSAMPNPNLRGAVFPDLR